jgi:putative colanic acid biosynthesis acetyltransferase WcaF
MQDNSCLADDADCYNVAQVTLAADATVSQYSYLCTATHDVADPSFRLYAMPIRVGHMAWVAAKAYVGPGVTVGEGAIAGANSCVYKDIPPWTIVGGNPAQFLKMRKLGDQNAIYIASKDANKT